MGQGRVRWVVVGEVSQPLTSADLNTWKHVAMTFNGTTLRLYVGGVLIGSAPGAHTTTNNPLLFGRWTPAAEYWNGLIDEVRIYGRALSQAEIQTDMGGAGTAPNVPPTVSLTTPVGGATFTAPATIAIAATATDSDGTVAKVDFYAGHNSGRHGHDEPLCRHMDRGGCRQLCHQGGGDRQHGSVNDVGDE